MTAEEELNQFVSVKKSVYNKDLAPFVSEFAGTFLLCVTVGLCAGIGATTIGGFAPLAIGSALMVSVFMGGHISGAHHNPAVTLAILMTGKMKSGMFGWGPVACAAGYVGAQLLASFAAGLVSYVISEDIGEKMGKPMVDKRAHWASAMWIEIMFTFFLALVVLNVACSKANEGKSFYGTAIGFLVFVAATAGGDVSGGAFNPAVGTGLTLCSGVVDAIGDVWIYWLGPCIGAALASLWFQATVDLE